MPLLSFNGPLYRPPYIARHLPCQKSLRNLWVTSGRLYTWSLSFNLYNLPRVCESVVLVVQTLPAAVRNLASRLKRVVAQHPLTYFFVSSATGTTSPCFKEIGIIRFPSDIFAVDVHILSYKAQSWKKTSFFFIEVISRLVCNTLFVICFAKQNLNAWKMS